MIGRPASSEPPTVMSRFDPFSQIDPVPAVTTGGDVVQGAGVFDAEWAGHGGNLPGRGKIQDLTPGSARLATGWRPTFAGRELHPLSSTHNFRTANSAVLPKRPSFNLAHQDLNPFLHKLCKFSLFFLYTPSGPR